MYIDHTVQDTAEFLIPHERAITLVFLTPTVVGRRRLLPSEICPQGTFRKPTSVRVTFTVYSVVKSRGVLFEVRSEICVLVLLHSCI